MSEPTPTDPAPQAPAPAADPAAADPTPTPADPPAEPTSGDEPLGDGGRKALEAEREARRNAEKERKALEAKLREYEDAQLSEKERLEKQVAEASKAAEDNARKVALYEAAVEYGLSKDDLELLDGVPADQIDARAKRLSERLATATPRTPKPDPTQGGRNGAGAGIDAQIAEAQGKGDWRTVLRLQNQKLAEQIVNQ